MEQNTILKGLLLWICGEPPAADEAGGNDTLSAFFGHQYLEIIYEPKFRTVISNFDPMAPDTLALAGNGVASLELIVVAASCVQYFEKENFTGPSAKVNKTPGSLELKLIEADHKGRDKILENLVISGEHPYPGIHFPILLWLAQKYLLVNLESTEDDFETMILRDQHPAIHALYHWISMRVSYIHQLCIPERIQSLRSVIFQHFEKTNQNLQLLWNQNNGLFSDEEKRCIQAAFSLECSLILEFYKKQDQCEKCIEQSRSLSKLSINMTGIMGKRTKYQQFETAQLVLQAKTEAPRNEKSENESVTTPKQETLPEENYLLETRKLVGEEDPEKLRPLDKAILLRLCAHVRAARPSKEDHQSREVEFAVAERAGLDVADWIIHSSFLLIRSRIDIESGVKADRGVLQMQSLVDQFDDENPPYPTRIKRLWLCDYPPIFLLKIELAKQYMSLGVLSTAAQIFEEMEQWEDLAYCLQMRNEREKAEQVIRKEIERKPTAQLYTALGDVTGDPAHYDTAWSLSGRRYSPAKRHLALLCLKQGNFEDCIRHFKEALELSPLVSTAWFTLGCACMAIGDFSYACTAFQRVVMIDPENGEAWANLATSLTKDGKKLEAIRALKEALKQRYESWRMWENYLYLCIETDQLSEALHAIERLIEIKGKDIDIDAIKAIVGYISKYIPLYGYGEEKSGEGNSSIGPKEGEKGEKENPIHERVRRVMDTLGSKRASDPLVWEIYANYYETIGHHPDKVLDCRLKQMRQLQVAGWDKETEKFQQAANGAKSLIKAYYAINTPQALSQARLFLRTFVQKTEQNFGNLAIHQELKEISNELSAAK